MAFSQAAPPPLCDHHRSNRARARRLARALEVLFAPARTVEEELPLAPRRRLT